MSQVASESLWRRTVRQPRNVIALGGASLLNDASSEMIYPLLPAFLTQVLGAGAPALGLVEGAAESVNSLVKLASGRLSDRVSRRKPLVLLGYALASVARPLIAATGAVWQVLALRGADRLGKGIRSAPRDALLAESVAPSARGLAFATQRAMDHAGALLGPLLAAALLLLMDDLRLIFTLAAIPAAGTLLLLVRAVREAEPAAGAIAGAGGSGAGGNERNAPARANPDEAAGPLAGLRDPQFRRVLLPFFVFTLGNSTDAFLLLRAGELGVATAALPLLWAALHLSKIAASLPGGHAADRLGPRGVVLAGWGVYALVYVGFALAASAWQVWLLFLVYGLYFGLTEGPERALIASYARPHRLGETLGGYHLATGIGALPASLGFGILWSWLGAPAAFAVGAALAALAGALLLGSARG